MSAKVDDWLIRAFIFLVLSLLCAGCSSGYVLSISHNNLSDSYIDPYRILVNAKRGFPAEVIGCSNGQKASSLSVLKMTDPPEFILVEWFHILSNTYYRARVDLDRRTAKWLHDSPFTTAAERRPALIVQWRGEKRVAVMLVADAADLSRNAIDIGEAVGESMAEPGDASNHSVSYESLRKSPGDGFIPGNVWQYDRTLDEKLTWEQRFTCPRRDDGSLDPTRLPPAKLPFFIGRNGEHIPCRDYSCSGQQETLDQLLRLGRKRYPVDSTPPALVFGNANNSTPAW